MIDQLQLNTAKYARWGIIPIVLLAPLSYLTCSYAVFNGDPTIYTIGFALNVGLELSLRLTNVLVNPSVWIVVRKWFLKLR